jgi:SET domain-containing protein
MGLRHSDYLEVRRIAGKGRGVIARKPIPKGTVFETVPVLLVKWDTISSSALADYAFAWEGDTAAIALGYGSLYNHSFKPNARYDDIGKTTKSYTALRDIKEGEEITINYNGEPHIKKKVDFEVLEA